MKKVYLAECVKAHTQTIKMESLVVYAESGIRQRVLAGRRRAL